MSNDFLDGVKASIAVVKNRSDYFARLRHNEEMNRCHILLESIIYDLKELLDGDDTKC